MKKFFSFIVLLHFSTLLAEPVLIPPKESKLKENSLLSFLLPENQYESMSRVQQFFSDLTRDEGGWSGNGGDSRNDTDNIWFIGDEPVKYCLSKSRQYPLKARELVLLIRQSLNQWLDFFRRYDLLERSLAKGYNGPIKNRLMFLDGENKKITSDFQYTNDCSEAKLQFLFGIENNIVNNYKKYHSDHLYGLAIRQTYDHLKFSHKGLIWIDHFSKNKLEIHHILLHELGHIFGMQHNSVPVMDEQFMSFIGKQRSYFSDFLGKIESDAWTYKTKSLHPLILTSRRGMRRQRRLLRRRGFTAKQCSDPSYVQNKLLPQKVLTALGFELNDCHKVSLELKGNMGHKRNKTHIFTLNIQEFNSKKQVSMLGKFRPSVGGRLKLDGPGVSTLLERTSRQGQSKHVFQRLTLEKTRSLYPLTGVFELNDESYPTKMSKEKGVVIEIFLPQTQVWWTLKTSHNQNP